jgi:hypothetical protein
MGIAYVMLVHITSHLPAFSYETNIYMHTSIFLIKQIVVEGDESNPTECITQYPISDTADNSGI